MLAANIYVDRTDGGRTLARSLSRYEGTTNMIVLGLPRGGMPVALEVSRALECPLDVVVVRKIGCPGQEEFAIGAIASGGPPFLNESVIERLRLNRDTINEIVAREHAELARREVEYRGTRPFPESVFGAICRTHFCCSLRNKTVLLVDDGLATGASMRVAVRAIRELNPARIVVAVPVASREAVVTLRAEEGVSEVVCPNIPRFFSAVGQWYSHFDQTTDDQVRECLLASAASLAQKRRGQLAGVRPSEASGITR
ncbi:putative phosphoribosyl transferase [Paratrimastix pyriformis]|uniref:Phosphoribosyl transferase n=1 Tax=Paratrimastix pyriformis TaxID=342808 RepID=A0ABQ8UQB5_9EUKA|nr:putative phosphoribosyl transferase [Paratrimastix pyriformis]